MTRLDMKLKIQRMLMDYRRFLEETVKAIAMVPFINEDVDEDLIGTRPIKANGSEILDEDYTWAFLYWSYFNLGRKSCFHRKQDEYRFNGYKYRRQE